MTEAHASAVHLFGIRHHGPGSARSLRDALVELRPDCLLVEGPPEAAEVVALCGHASMKPPVALLLYRPDQPQRAVYYPFAEFSPEWQAIRHAVAAGIPIRFMDLPLTHRLALEAAEPDAPADGVSADPIGYLAAAAGYGDGERWWEHMVEHRRDRAGLFAAIQEAMAALREREDTPPAPAAGAAASSPDAAAVFTRAQIEQLREACMRQTLRAAQKEGFARIAVVCGAWHGPALAKGPAARHDAALLKGLPKVKVAATWVPWTNGRLTFASGYGAGIESPGWYQHVWDHAAEGPARVAGRWLARVAALLREEDLDASPASVIEAVRLAEALAALRRQPLPGLRELNEATETVLCFGDATPLRLIARRLMVGEALGEIPAETPMVPLQQDLLREQKRLRFPPAAAEKLVDLDLRNETDRARSQLLHRLNLLGLPWGTPEQARGQKGTFHELWRVAWQPEFAVKVIEAATWGNTVAAAAGACALKSSGAPADLPALTRLLDACLLADLPEAVATLITRLQNESAAAADIGQMMDALPPLARIARYGNVRQTDGALVGRVLGGLVARICVGLPGACAALNDEAAEALYERLLATQSALALLQDESLLEPWRDTLRRLADQAGLHGLIAGRSTRLLLDGGLITPDDAARRLGLALSVAGAPEQAAAWCEGFLKGSGLLLLHDDRLWALVDGWLTGLPADTFTALLPLLRRTFSTFAAPERRQMGERAAGGAGPAPSAAVPADLDEARADRALPLLACLLGLNDARDSHQVPA